MTRPSGHELDHSFGQLYMQLYISSGSVLLNFWFGFTEFPATLRSAFILESVCCLLVLNTVTSTPQWIRQPKPRGCVFVFVCKYVLGRS
jgi:hypothetical protein